MVIVGLTGGIGSGKSAVAALLAARGAAVVDADALAREAVEPRTPAHAAILERFGPSVVDRVGALDRAKVADVVFRDPAALEDLNAITHPAVGALMAQRLAEIAGRDREEGTETAVVLEIPLLTSSTRERYPMAGVIVVDAPDEVRFARLVETRKMDPLDVRSRMAAQIGREERLGLADFVLDNSGDRDHLSGEVARAWTWIGTLSTR